MKKPALLSIFIFIILISVFSSSAFAAGPAGVYKITITKMELFDGSSFVTVFNGSSSTIDIAAVSAGQSAGNFLSGISVPDGTYTQARSTVSKSFTIKGNDGSGNHTTAAVTANGCTLTTTAADEAECTITIPTAAPVDTTVFTSPVTVTDGNFSHKIRVSFDTSSAIGDAASGGIFPAAPTVTVTTIPF